MTHPSHPDDHFVTRRRLAAKRRARRQHPRWRTRLLQYITVLLLLMLLSIAASLSVLDWSYRGRIMAHVSVQGLPLDHLTPDEGRAVLRQRYAPFLKQPLELRFGERTWSPTLEQLGVTLEIDAAVERAYTAGRSANVLRNLPEFAAIWRDGLELPVQVTVDEQQTQAYLTELAREIDRAPANATLQIVQGRVVSTPARVGRQTLVDATYAELLAGLQTLMPQSVSLQTRALRPQVEDSGVIEVQQQLGVLLSAPVMVTAGERSWTWSPEQLGALVRLMRVAGADGQGQRIEATLDRRQLEHWLDDRAAEIDAVPVEPRLRFGSAGLAITQLGHDGARLERTQALDQLATALWQTSRAITLPVTRLQPQARPETLAQLGIIERVAQGKSSFQDSAPYRVQNIQAGARQMDGVLIAPGAEFSFNQTIGAINESNGFTQGYAIIDGRTQIEWGGGVCQVSTTVFRAAFWAGVPLTERNQHSFRIRWYETFEPIGMDAAIFTGPGGYDLRFVNDTDNWLLMQTAVDTDNQVLYIDLYGTKPNDREVIQTPPTITNEIPAPTKPRYVNDPTVPAGTIKQTDAARGGMDVRVGRIVKQNGQVLYQDTFFSRFQPWPNIFVRGTGR